VKTYSLTGIFCAACVAVLMFGCSTAPKSEEGKQSLTADADAALKQMMATDPSLKPFLDKSYAYAVFPHVGKGGFIAGGSYGRGVVYEQGNPIGYSDMSQATVGLQAGGQSFSEILAFERKEDLDRFTSGRLTFAANASAVALKSGAGDTARYTDGVAVFVKPIGGLMAEAALGGQQFTYQPK
jgi:lipid-binding SYLF domain-containing protein